MKFGICILIALASVSISFSQEAHTVSELQTRIFRHAGAILQRSETQKPSIDAQNLLKEYGISFPKNTKATYYPNSDSIIVTHYTDVLEQISFILEATSCYPSQTRINLKFVYVNSQEILRFMHIKSGKSVLDQNFISQINEYVATHKSALLLEVQNMLLSGESFSIKQSIAEELPSSAKTKTNGSNTTELLFNGKAIISENTSLNMTCSVHLRSYTPKGTLQEAKQKSSLIMPIGQTALLSTSNWEENKDHGMLFILFTPLRTNYP
jgi:hypothetical protein